MWIFMCDIICEYFLNTWHQSRSIRWHHLMPFCFFLFSFLSYVFNMYTVHECKGNYKIVRKVTWKFVKQFLTSRKLKLINNFLGSSLPWYVCSWTVSYENRNSCRSDTGNQILMKYHAILANHYVNIFFDSLTV